MTLSQAKALSKTLTEFTPLLTLTVARMFEQETILVLGAGSSADFGLPTGRQVLELLKNESPSIRPGNSARYFDSFIDTISTSDFNRLNNFWDDFVKSAQNSSQKSIDLFVYNNPSMSDLGKLYVSWAILKSMYKRNRYKDSYKKDVEVYNLLTRWRDARNDNWITDFANVYQQGCRGARELQQNRISVVTFNYESVFIDAVEFFLRKTERFSDVTTADLPACFSVYGTFPSLPERFGRSEFSHFISQCANNIFFIQERRENNDKILKIRQKIMSAEYIYLLGFAADPENFRIIGLEDSPAKKIAMNYDGNMLVQQNYNIINAHVSHKGDATSPLSSSAACDQGFLSQNY